MLVPFLIMLREGIEASLIVGIVATYLVQTGRKSWLFAVWAGVVLAVLLCAAVGLGIAIINADFPQKQQELFEAVIGVVAVFMLTSMVFWMKQAARSIKAGLQGSIDAALSEGAHHGLALVGLVFFAVAREGLESMVFLLATFEQSTGPWAAIGALLGLACAVVVGFAIYWGGVRINLSRFSAGRRCSSSWWRPACSPARSARCTRPASGTGCSRWCSTGAMCCPRIPRSDRSSPAFSATGHADRLRGHRLSGLPARRTAIFFFGAPALPARPRSAA